MENTDRKRTPQESRDAILRYIDRLSAEFVGRREIIELMAVAVIAGEPMLLLGPPGTAKSEMIVKFCRGLGLENGDYFEYMITAFTEPSEIVGPVDIKSLREDGVYRRILDGKIADSRVVFLDEIFNGNSAILNTLLTVMNERKIYQAGTALALDRLAGFFAASNGVPERSELDALKDRFVIKAFVDQVHRDSFSELLGAGLRNDVHRAANRTPWIVPDAVSLDDFENVMDFLRTRLSDGFGGEGKCSVPPAPVANKFFYLSQEIEKKGVRLTDREIIKLFKVIMAAAFLLNGHLPESLTESDLFMLRYVADSKEKAAAVRACVDEAIELSVWA